VKIGHHLFIFEWVLSRWKLEFLVVAGFAPLLLWWSFPKQLNCHHFFPFRLGRLGCITPFGTNSLFVLGHRRLELFSWFLSYLCLFDKFLLDIGFNNSHTNFYSVEKIVTTCLKQRGQGHACGAHERERLQNLSMYSHTDSPLFCTIERSLSMVTSVSSS